MSASPSLDSRPLAFSSRPLGISLKFPFPAVPRLVVATITPRGSLWRPANSCASVSFCPHLPSTLAARDLDKNETLTMSLPTVSKVKAIASRSSIT